MACWILHYILVFSFTAKDLTNTGLFATLLTDQEHYGNIFLNLIQMRPGTLLRYMIVSFLLARGQPNDKYKINKDALEEYCLPLALQEIQESETTGVPASALSRYLKALYEDYDMEVA